MRRTVLFSFLILNFLWAGAKEIDLSLEKAIDLALNNDFSYRISRKQVDIYRQRLKNIGFLPQVTLDGYKNLDEKLQILEIPSFTGGDPQQVSLDFTKNYEFTLQILQPIFTGGKAYLGFRNSLIDLKSSKEQLAESREETILRVKKSFFNILVMQEYLKAQREARDLMEKNLQNVRQSFELGLVSQYDLLRAQLSASSIIPEVSRAQNQYEIAVLSLKNILQLPEDVEPKIIGKLSVPEFDSSLDKLLGMGLQNRFELRQIDFEKQKLANLLKIAYGQYLPSVSLVASYSYRSDFFNFHKGNWENNYSINLAVSFPIFPGLSRNAQVGELRVSRKIMDLNKQMLSSATRLEVENRYKTIKQEFDNINQAQKNLELAGEGVRIAELNYSEGMISILELNTSFNELTNARVALLQALFNCNINIAELEKLVGIQYRGGEK